MKINQIEITKVGVRPNKDGKKIPIVEISFDDTIRNDSIFLKMDSEQLRTIHSEFDKCIFDNNFEISIKLDKSLKLEILDDHFY